MEPLKDANPPTSFDDLPPETVVEILTRLPVKTLIRSTSVKKSWYSLIINPNFISAHIRRSISYCDENAVFIVPNKISPQNPCSLFSVETFSATKKFEIPFSTKSGYVQIVGSVNGLACLTDSSFFYWCRDLYLWNPSIRRYKTLVSSCFKELPTEWSKPYCTVGFGYHKTTDDYRVVRVLYFADDESNFCGKVAPKVEIYSLRRNTWREIKDPVVPRLVKDTGVYVNGSVYWLEAPGQHLEELWILSFDINNEVFGEVKLPDKVWNCLGKNARVSLYKLEGTCVSLLELEGSISVCFFDLRESPEASQPICIWVMRLEDGAWIRRFRVVLKKKHFIWPLKITKSGTLVMEAGYRDLNSTFLVSFNLKNLHSEDLGFESFKNGPSTVDTPFIESLVLLEGRDALLRHAN